MKFPTHIILDWNSSNIKYSSQYWIFKSDLSSDSSHNYFINFAIQNQFSWSNRAFFKNKFLDNQLKYTIKYSNNTPDLFLNETEKKLYKNFFGENLKMKGEKISSNNPAKNIHNFLNDKKKKYDHYNLKRLHKIFNFNENTDIFKNSSLWRFFDINFLRKERIYTKLKYSRVPQYDIVSGGVAAIFAGFLGFLICEKFGFELLDSGDFYVLVMYIVFFCFFSKLYLKLFSNNSNSWSIVSFKWFFFFYKSLIHLFFKYFSKKIFKK